MVLPIHNLTCPPARRQAAAFGALWLFIAVVSVIDGFLVVQFRDDIVRNELNPVGRALLHLNGGRIWLLLAVKFLGTVTAGGLLLVIHERSPRLGVGIAAVIAGLQLWLLWFLTMA